MQKDVLVKWSKTAKDTLVNKTIIDARYLTPKEAEDMGWFNSGVLIWLNDGTEILVSQDDEGNGPGALMIFSDNKHSLLPTI